LRGSLVIGAGLFAAQLLGFVRQILIGYLLGTGAEADALSAAMAPIETWWTVFAVALIFGFAPLFSEARGSRAYRLSSVLWPIIQLSSAATVLLLVFAKPVLLAFAPGLDEQAALLGVQLLRVFSVSVTGISASFVYSSFLFSRRKFLIPSLQHATVNVATILGALMLYQHWGVYAFAVGYTVGVWLQLFVNYLCARPLVALQPQDTGRLSLRQVVTAPGSILVQAIAIESNIAVTRAYASTFGLGMTAAFEFGFKLLRVPAALLVVPLSQALLPELADHPDTASDHREPLRTTVRATWLLAAVTAVALITMVIIRRPLVALLFERGEFGEASTSAVAMILLAYAPAMLGRVIADFLSRLLFAMGKMRLPAVAAVAGLAVNLVISLLLPSTWPELIGLGALIGFLAGTFMLIRYVGELRRHA
jgi:putative peptidoglycan lipid II flippase